MASISLSRFNWKCPAPLSSPSWSPPTAALPSSSAPHKGSLFQLTPLPLISQSSTMAPPSPPPVFKTSPSPQLCQPTMRSQILLFTTPHRSPSTKLQSSIPCCFACQAHQCCRLILAGLLSRALLPWLPSMLPGSTNLTRSALVPIALTSQPPHPTSVSSTTPLSKLAHQTTRSARLI